MTAEELSHDAEVALLANETRLSRVSSTTLAGVALVDGIGAFKAEVFAEVSDADENTGIGIQLWWLQLGLRQLPDETEKMIFGTFNSMGSFHEQGRQWMTIRPVKDQRGASYICCLAVIKIDPRDAFPTVTLAEKISLVYENIRNHFPPLLAALLAAEESIHSSQTSHDFHDLSTGEVKRKSPRTRTKKES